MWKDKLKTMFSKNGEEGNPKKKLENLVVFLVTLVITIIVINVIWNQEEDTNQNRVDSSDSNKRLAQTSQTMLENTEAVVAEEDKLVTNLEEILSKINGVGKVKVMITYSETSKVMPVYNEENTEENTEETDNEGGTRKVTQSDTRKEVIYEEKDGEKTIITQSTSSPTIEGAIVTAEGASNATVKTNIILAVEAVTGLATHNIQVFEMAV